VVIAIQLLSSHPVLTEAVEEQLWRLQDSSVQILPSMVNEAEVLRQPGPPRLFLLDACSLRTELGPLAGRCRAQFPGSKFLALLAPGNESLAEKTHLFYWGIEGFLELDKTWQSKLPDAIRAILKGGFWVPYEMTVTFIQSAKALLDAQLLSGHCLTAREGQVLQLIMRKLTNKEISGALGISERTVKFHVSNILGKLQLEDRRGLSPDKFVLKAFASGA
jgi:DNA-binding NarL/FixJ family response regulator